MFLLGPTSIVVEFQNALMQFETLILICLEFANGATHGFRGCFRWYKIQICRVMLIALGCVCLRSCYCTGRIFISVVERNPMFLPLS